LRDLWDLWDLWDLLGNREKQSMLLYKAIMSSLKEVWGNHDVMLIKEAYQNQNPMYNEKLG